MGFPWLICLILVPLSFCDQLNFDEAVFGLSELPLEKLLHVQKEFSTEDKGIIAVIETLYINVLAQDELIYKFCVTRPHY